MLASRSQIDDAPVINMTPMVDVILCLLVFFMAATRLYDWDESEFRGERARGGRGDAGVGGPGRPDPGDRQAGLVSIDEIEL